ncbi:protein phosphatase 1 regulatory subunit 27 isoform X1 [Corvus hawaiiensis]|uniref:protein phosphatase 1 regulatory subunit 27 isoform X1 n=1 Tax=Corvus kubaryi TaxID=68294 RepID=UPI001C05C5A7|nr:protein phosphatase 1 regulatory subunit 27 isoform X1 [Corvus kubaryi]XP_048179831.1 protein phosphatase 1 regulatory subunit 27 isoform X1 [Corvus hawaiiensis]
MPETFLVSPCESWSGLGAAALRGSSSSLPLSCLARPVGAAPSQTGYSCCRRATGTHSSSSGFLSLRFFPHSPLPEKESSWTPFLSYAQLVSSGCRALPQARALTPPLPSGMAALHEAVLTGNLDCVKLLVKYGADIHQRDENGWTPLHMACSDGYADIARYLLSLGASLEATTDDGEKPSDLIDPEYEDLVQLFGATALR